MQDGSSPVEAMEALESEVMRSTEVRTWNGQDIVNPLHQRPEGGSEVLFVPTQASQSHAVSSCGQCLMNIIGL